MQRLEAVSEIVYAIGFFVWLYATWRQTKARRYYEEEAKRLAEFNAILDVVVARHRKRNDAEPNE